MTPEQIDILLKSMDRIASRQFVLTQATDWVMLEILGGVFLTLAVLAVGFFWRDVGKKFESSGIIFSKGIDDIKQMIRDFKSEDNKAHESIKAEFEKADDIIHRIIKDCQKDCCPPRRRIDD